MDNDSSYDYSLPQDSYGSDYSQLLERVGPLLSYLIPLLYEMQFPQSKKKDIYAEQSPYSAPATQQRELYAQIKSYGIRNIPREEVE